MMMNNDNYSTCELQEAYIALYETICHNIWKEINIELARRLDKDEYQQFVEYARLQARLQVD